MDILYTTKATKASTVEKIKYESLMVVIKYLENLEASEAKIVLWSLPKEGFLKNDIVDYFFKQAQKNDCIAHRNCIEKEVPMNILDIAIVSNTDMMKNYKDCRKKAGNLNKIFILKNNQPDAVLFSINKYEKLSAFIEYLDNLDEEDLLELHESLPKNGFSEMDELKQMILELQKNEKTMAASIDHVSNEVHTKMDDIKNEVIGGHNKILGELKSTSDVLSKKINEQ